MTKETAIDLMKGRGYTMVSEAGNGSWIGFSRDMGGSIHIGATLHLEKESISLHGGVLKLMCELNCKNFDANHARFEDFERTIYYYTKVCNQVDIDVTDLGLIKDMIKEAKMPEVVKVKETLSDRIEKFKKLVIEIGKEKGYPPAMCKKFFEYWGEINDGGKKMRWEIQKQKSGVFNVKGRMVTWYGKDQVYNAQFVERDDRKAAKQNAELKKKPVTINTKDLF
jgi:hypothetical protein